MKTIILSLLFLILSIQLRSQGIDTLQSYSEKESGILIESFIEFICLSDSMTMVQFNHYFANDYGTWFHFDEIHIKGISQIRHNRFFPFVIHLLPLSYF